MDLGPDIKIDYALPFVPFKNEEEYQYLNILKKIVNHGIKREDRTGTGTVSIFGETQEFNLRDTFPMLTTKRMFFRGIFEELMLYLVDKPIIKFLMKKVLIFGMEIPVENS